MDGMKRIHAAFYESHSGNAPVREWLLSLDKADRRVIGEDIASERMVLLHGFVKKTQQTPLPDLTLARRRLREIEE